MEKMKEHAHEDVKKEVDATYAKIKKQKYAPKKRETDDEFSARVTKGVIFKLLNGHKAASKKKHTKLA